MSLYFFRKVGLLMALICSLTSSCTKEEVSEQELREYVRNEKHGLIKKEVQGKNEVMIAFRPADLLVAQEMNGSMDSLTLKNLKLKYSMHYYFVLSIKQDGKEALSPSQLNSQDFSNVLQTVSFRMGEYINMTTPKDTIPLADYAFNRTFGMAGSTDILIAFEKEKTKNQPYVKINLFEFGLGLGKQSLQFDVRDLLNAPQIRFK